MNYGIIHKPLLAKVLPNRRDPNRVVTFIGRQLCLFENNSVQPEVGTTVEIMITRGLYSVYPAGHEREGRTDWNRLRSVLVQMVDPDRHLLVAINGFECAGTMCRTTARGVITDGTKVWTDNEVYPRDKEQEKKVKTMWLTPGRTDIFEASNVNVRVDRSNAVERRPTNVWVERSQYEEKSGCGVRILGLTRVEDATWARAIKA